MLKHNLHDFFVEIDAVDAGYDRRRRMMEAMVPTAPSARKMLNVLGSGTIVTVPDVLLKPMGRKSGSQKNVLKSGTRLIVNVSPMTGGAAVAAVTSKVVSSVSAMRTGTPDMPIVPSPPIYVSFVVVVVEILPAGGNHSARLSRLSR